ncbi:MAG: ribose 5-phosphate isomerase B [Myxococcales bacterium]|nr:ribose 5-phosphate isomerase B [Myxococcales bacterium]
MTWGAGRRLVLASDHAAVELRCLLAKAATLWGFEVEDLGPSTTDSIDYPIQAKRLADRLAQDGEAMGVLVCGTGIGMSMVANRFSHLRAAAVSDDFTAQATRAHNDANVLCLGSRTLGPGLAEQLLKTFLSTAFEGGRHQRRVDLFPSGASTKDIKV